MLANLKFKKEYFSLIGFIFSIVLLTIVKFYFHELWKDEWQAWFVAKDKNIFQVFSFLYYEGHPSLWYLYLKIFVPLHTIFGLQSEVVIQIAHLLAAIVVNYIFWFKFKMPNLIKVIFALSYFMLFEYGVVNRGYILVILLLFWAIIKIKDSNVKGISLGWTLLLLCQTEVYGVMMAIALGAFIYLKEKNIFSKEIIYLLVGIIVFGLSVFPRSDGHIAKTQSKVLEFSERILQGFQGNFSNTFLPGVLPDTNVFGWSFLGLTLSSVLVAVFVFLFYKEKLILKTFALWLLFAFGFSTFFFLGGIRHWGMGFIFFMAILELSNHKLWHNKWKVGIIVLIGVSQMYYGINALNQDWQKPFTNAQKAGEFIMEKVPLKVPVVGINKFEITPVIGYAKRNFYELPDGVEFSYFRWVDKIYVPTEEELKLFAKFKGVGGIVIISPKKLDPVRFSNVKLWQEFTDENIKNENYYLYSLEAK